MNTEITDMAVAPERGWVLYDQACAMCNGGARRWQSLLQRYGFEVAPLQSDWVRRRLGCSEAELLHEMRVLTASGEVFGGSRAVLYLARIIPWGWPLVVLAVVPGFKTFLDWLYRAVAANRQAISRLAAFGGPAAWRRLVQRGLGRLFRRMS